MAHVSSPGIDRLIIWELVCSDPMIIDALVPWKLILLKLNLVLDLDLKWTGL